MSALVVDIAEAVKDALNDAQLLSVSPFSQSFTAERKALPLFKLDDMDTLHVTVVPRELEISLETRAKDTHEVKVDVAIQQQVDSIETTDVDPLLALVQEIADYLNRKAMSGAHWLKTENKPIYAPDHLHEKNQFTSVLTLTYRASRP